MHYDFHWLLAATQLLTAKLHSRYVKESESEILESSSRIFYLRLRNPGHDVIKPDVVTTFLHTKVQWTWYGVYAENYSSDHSYRQHSLTWGLKPGLEERFVRVKWVQDDRDGDGEKGSEEGIVEEVENQNPTWNVMKRGHNSQRYQKVLIVSNLAIIFE